LLVKISQTNSETSFDFFKQFKIEF